ncbi:hypothetical protein ACFFKU_06705 [Kineococcus gynurae]|uniref:Uncharacterized protein n=1 Tax=Kineococcus gynurae TaxID=452979 RepID=A0ABV5LX14_9ACTN
MTSPASGALRLLRSTVTGGAVVALASGAHLAGGGRLPGPVAWLALLVLVACASFTLTRRRLGRRSLLAALTGGQLVLHTLFTVLAPDAVRLAAAGHHHVLVLPDPAAGTMPLLPLLPVPAGGTDLAMAGAHAAATVATALLLAHGEDVLWRTWAWLLPLVPSFRVLTLPVPGRPRSRPVAAEPARPRDAHPGRRARRRGPPVGCPAV